MRSPVRLRLPTGDAYAKGFPEDFGAAKAAPPYCGSGAPSTPAAPWNAPACADAYDCALKAPCCIAGKAASKLPLNAVGPAAAPSAEEPPEADPPPSVPAANPGAPPNPAPPTPAANPVVPPKPCPTPGGGCAALPARLPNAWPAAGAAPQGADAIGFANPMAGAGFAGDAGTDADEPTDGAPVIDAPPWLNRDSPGGAGPNEPPGTPPAGKNVPAPASPGGSTPPGGTPTPEGAAVGNAERRTGPSAEKGSGAATSEAELRTLPSGLPRTPPLDATSDPTDCSPPPLPP